MTVGIILLNTPLFIRESKSAIGAVRAEILRQAPECEMLQLTDEIVIFDQSEKVTESALRRGLDVWNVQLRKREERRAKEEAVYREDIYRSAAWRARMTAWLEGQEKKVQRREEVEDGRRGRDYRLRGRTGNSRGSLEEEEEGDTPPEEGGIAPPPVVAETAPSSTEEGNTSPATAIDAEQPQYAGALVPLPVSTRAERGLFRWPCKFVAGLVHPFMCLAGRAK